jgi:sugar lactone lactonase YvrE
MRYSLKGDPVKKLTLALMLAVLVPASLLAHPPNVGTLETLVSFNPQALETPENLVVDRSGTIYVSLALTGEIRRIAPDGAQSTLIMLPIGAPLTACGPLFGAITGIALDPEDGTLYSAVAACDVASRGIWRISPHGHGQVIANLPLAALPNGIALEDDEIYVADSSLGVIWRVPAEGGPAEVWLDHSLLKPPPGAPAGSLGPNGLKVFKGEVYVSNSAAATIVAVPINRNGTAGEPRIHAHLPAAGCDDFSFDVHGALYCATKPTLTKVNQDGSTEVLLTAADGLDGPTATAFGRQGQDRFNLYITNGAFPFDSTTHRPSLMRLRLGVPGESPGE